MYIRSFFSQRGDLIGCRQLGVRFAEPDVQEKRLIGICLGFQAVDRITNDDLTGVTFHRASPLAVAHKVRGIPVTGICAIAYVISKNQYHVGLFVLGKTGANQQQGA